MSRKIVGLKDYKTSAPPPGDDESDEEGGAGGGRGGPPTNAYVGSGINVQNPKKPKNMVDAIMKKQTTGGAASEKPVDMKVKLVFFKSGYTIDAGEGPSDCCSYETPEGKVRRGDRERRSVIGERERESGSDVAAWLACCV